jgi:hypothetical protein
MAPEPKAAIKIVFGAMTIGAEGMSQAIFQCLMYKLTDY